MNIKAMLMLLILLLSELSVYCAFEHQSWSVRAAGLGEAFTAVADDAGTLLYNPAGTAQIDNYELMGMYTWLYAGLDAETMNLFYSSFILPLANFGTCGLGWANFNASELYQENTLIINYANRLNSFFNENSNGLLKNTAVGVNLKYMGCKYDLSTSILDPVFDHSDSKYVFTFDLGVLSKLSITAPDNYLTVGIGVFNIIPAEIGLYNPEQIPLVFKGGVSYSLKAYPVFQKISMQDPLLAWSLTYQNNDYDLHFGWENRFLSRIFAWRIGSSLDNFSLGAGISQNLKRNFLLQVDYAFSVPYHVMESSGNHKVSFLLQF